MLIRCAGYTLLEVLVAVVVFAILAGVAIPTLQEPLRKARRTHAIATLGKAQMDQEAWRAAHREFDTRATLATPAPSAVLEHYTFARETPPGADPATAYRITATARPGSTQARDEGCQFMGIDVIGGRVRHLAGRDAAAAASGAAADRCWSRS